MNGDGDSRGVEPVALSWRIEERPGLTTSKRAEAKRGERLKVPLEVSAERTRNGDDER